MCNLPNATIIPPPDPNPNTNTDATIILPTLLTPHLIPHLTLHPLRALPSLDLPLPICLTCHLALLPQTLLSHFRKHRNHCDIQPLSPAFRKEIQGLANTLVTGVSNSEITTVTNSYSDPGLESSSSTFKYWDFNNIPKPANGSKPIKKLKVVDAWQCCYCIFIRRDVTDVRRHVNQVHNVSAAGNYRGVRAQSWFGGSRTEYWSVDDEGACVKDSAMGGMGAEGSEVMDGTVGGDEYYRTPVEGQDEEKEDEGGEDVSMELRECEADKVGKESGNEVLDRQAQTKNVGINRNGDGSLASICSWGFYGKGWGHRHPTSWK